MGGRINLIEKLQAFVKVVRKRLAEATTFQQPGELWGHADGEKIWLVWTLPDESELELSIDDIVFLEHAPTDLRRLLALVEAGQDVVRMAEQHHVYDDAIPSDVGCHVCDALARYQAAVQEATRDG